MKNLTEMRNRNFLRLANITMVLWSVVTIPRYYFLDSRIIKPILTICAVILLLCLLQYVMLKKRRAFFFRNIMIRLLFYGLFFVGPCALTESHALHTRMKQKSALVDSVNANEKTHQEFQRKIALLDAVGMSAIGLWFVWLGFAVVWQIKRIGHDGRELRDSNA